MSTTINGKPQHSGDHMNSTVCRYTVPR